jgi:hypothetical protein
LKDVQATEASVLKREHQKMKFLNFFLFLWIIFALLDSDPDCESGSGSRDPTESGSNPDPQHWSYGYDPEHCFKVNCPLLLIQFESGFNWISGSGSGLGIRIQAGKICPPKKGNFYFEEPARPL